MQITDEERRAIAALKRVAKKWPETLWLYSAAGSLCVMKKGTGGERAMRGDGADPDYTVTTIDIENDGGDW